MACSGTLDIDFAILLAKKPRQVLEALLDAVSLIFADKRNPAKCLFAGIWGWA